jgi:hypothetical protein
VPKNFRVIFELEGYYLSSMDDSGSREENMIYLIGISSEPNLKQ